jgi:hypothetical protein
MKTRQINNRSWEWRALAKVEPASLADPGRGDRKARAQLAGARSFHRQCTVS